MSMQLEPCAELALRASCAPMANNCRRSFQFNADPPFENQYADYDAYLSTLTGEDVEGGLAHFHKKADEADPETVGTFPAEVLVNLLVRLERPRKRSPSPASIWPSSATNASPAQASSICAT